MEPAPSGWRRFVLKSKFGAGRDFAVTDPDDTPVFFVDGKLSARPKADVKDAQGAVRYRLNGPVIEFPKRLTITDAQGTTVASMKAKLFSPIKSKMTVSMADGSSWQVEGNLIEKNYSVKAGGSPVAQISQKWVTIRDSYTLDVVDGVDPALALAVVWAVDRWSERSD